MAKSMTPPVETGMTDGQIDKAVDLFRARLRKHRAQFPSGAVQNTLLDPQLGHDLLAEFQRHVEAASGMIIRRVRVNRNRTPEQVISATGRKQFTNKAVLTSMPHGEGEEVDVYFFQLNRWVSDNELAREFEQRGLMPDQFAQAQVNTKDPAFADKHPNASHWKDADGNWCYLAFCRWGGRRRVGVSRRDDGWRGDWWFAGVRK